MRDFRLFSSLEFRFVFSLIVPPLKHFPLVFISYCVMTWSVILIALLSIKITLMWEVTKGALTVPLAVLVLDLFSCFFMLMSSVFGPYFSSGYFCSEVEKTFSE